MTTHQTDHQWYTTGAGQFIDLNLLAAVAEYMIEHGSASEVPRMLEKPYNYADVYAAMLRGED